MRFLFSFFSNLFSNQSSRDLSNGKKFVFHGPELTFRTLFLYRIRTEETTEANYPSDGLYETVSETESEDEDEETSKEEPTTNRRTRSPGNHRVSSAARLVSSSGLSSLQATTTSSTSSDADSGIGGVSPRVSAAAFGESTLSPSQSILYIDSISARNSVFHDTTKVEEQSADDSTNEPEEKSNSTLPANDATTRAHRIPWNSSTLKGPMSTSGICSIRSC